MFLFASFFVVSFTRINFLLGAFYFVFLTLLARFGLTKVFPVKFRDSVTKGLSRTSVLICKTLQLMRSGEVIRAPQFVLILFLRGMKFLSKSAATILN